MKIELELSDDVEAAVVVGAMENIINVDADHFGPDAEMAKWCAAYIANLFSNPNDGP